MESIREPIIGQHCSRNTTQAFRLPIRKPSALDCGSALAESSSVAVNGAVENNSCRLSAGSKDAATVSPLTSEAAPTLCGACGADRPSISHRLLTMVSWLSDDDTLARRSVSPGLYSSKASRVI